MPVPESKGGFHFFYSVLPSNHSLSCFSSPSLLVARCLAPNVWHGISQIDTFCKAATTGFDLTPRPFKTEGFIYLLPRTSRVEAPPAEKGSLYVKLDFVSKEMTNLSDVDYLEKVSALSWAL